MAGYMLPRNCSIFEKWMLSLAIPLPKDLFPNSHDEPMQRWISILLERPNSVRRSYYTTDLPPCSKFLRSDKEPIPIRNGSGGIVNRGIVHQEKTAISGFYPTCFSFLQRISRCRNVHPWQTPRILGQFSHQCRLENDTKEVFTEHYHIHYSSRWTWWMSLI